MVFADLFFLYIFLPVCLIAYFACKNVKYKNGVLIVFSLLFYAWGEPTVVLLLILSTIVNWLLGLAIDKHRKDALGKLAVAGSLVFSLGMLMVFKYLGFIVENLNLRRTTLGSCYLYRCFHSLSPDLLSDTALSKMR